jgi:hypothetical protein
VVFSRILPHFDMPGLLQLLNYRLADAMPARLRYEGAALLEIDDQLKRWTKIEEYLDQGFGARALRASHFFRDAIRRQLSCRAGLRPRRRSAKA